MYGVPLKLDINLDYAVDAIESDAVNVEETLKPVGSGCLKVSDPKESREQ